MIDPVLSAPFLDPLRLMRIPAELEIIYLGSDRKELPLANFATLLKDSVTRFFQKLFVANQFPVVHYYCFLFGLNY
jgi:hypothetical protein